MENIDVKDIIEYQQAIEKVKEKFPTCWFRGLTDKDYKLEPSLYRKPFKPELEPNFLGLFKSQSTPFLKTIPRNDWEWLFLMQHYGVPTRFMDWTEHPLVALTFALKNIPEKGKAEKDLIVYCLNPIKLNSKVSGINHDDNDPIPFIGPEEEFLYGVKAKRPNNLPLAVIGPLNSDRIVVQKGTFTLFPFRLEKEITQNDDSKDFLMSITLKEGGQAAMKKSLENLGFTYNSLFPGLDSIADAIIKPYKEE